MRLQKSLGLLAAVVALSGISAAATLKGTVKNGTNNKPVAGDEVVLIELGQGMQEVARTKTDAKGNFSFNYQEGGPHLVRALHQGVNYFPQGGMVPPGTTSVEVTVYDAAKNVDGLGLTVDMMRVEAQGDKLQATELWAVRNNSNPPRTQMSDNAFEIYLPAGAQIDSSSAAGPGGQPIQSAPVPQSEKNKYAFVYPLRPGETRFQVSYHLPYSGKFKMQPKLLYPVDHVVVMLPKSMQFATGGAAFQSMSGGDPNATIQVITSVNPGTDLSFNVSGTGTMPNIPETARSGGGGGPAAGGGGGGQGGGTMGEQGGRPGGGLGTPEETPDPLHRYRGFILGGLAIALALGVFYVVTRPQHAPAAAANARVPQRPAPEPPAAKRAAAPDRPVPQTVRVQAPQPRGETTGSSDRLLEALKDELFQLELERHQGKISAEDYAQAKAALDTTLARAAKRAGS